LRSKCAVNPYSLLLNKTNETGSTPKAYLNYLVFDDKYQLLNGGFIRITEAAREYGQDGAHERLVAELAITQPGFVYIYLSNDNVALGGAQTEVFFDDFNVVQVNGLIVQADDYYPFGLTFNSYQRENSIKQKYQYNGIEKVDESDLGVSQSFFRMHDPALGRWWQIDPKPNPMYSLYSAMDNNPIRYSDPLGDTIIVDKKGYITRNDKTDNLVFMQGTKGKLTSIGEVGKKINANTIYKNLAKANGTTAKGIWSPFTFRNMVKNKGEWDLKNNTKTIFGLANHYKESTTSF
jgi:RHS repeat-associated protein